MHYQLHRLADNNSQTCMIRVEPHPGGDGFRILRMWAPDEAVAHLLPVEQRFSSMEVAAQRAEAVVAELHREGWRHIVGNSPPTRRPYKRGKKKEDSGTVAEVREI